jgi:hypothetical protein
MADNGKQTLDQRAFGTRDASGVPVGAGSVFAIASMTWSSASTQSPFLGWMSMDGGELPNLVRLSRVGRPLAGTADPTLYSASPPAAH